VTAIGDVFRCRPANFRFYGRGEIEQTRSVCDVRHARECVSNEREKPRSVRGGIRTGVRLALLISWGSTIFVRCLRLAVARRSTGVAGVRSATERTVLSPVRRSKSDVRNIRLARCSPWLAILRWKMAVVDIPTATTQRRSSLRTLVIESCAGVEFLTPGVAHRMVCSVGSTARSSPSHSSRRCTRCITRSRRSFEQLASTTSSSQVWAFHIQQLLVDAIVSKTARQ
jgi:hypothetical protein